MSSAGPGVRTTRLSGASRRLDSGPGTALLAIGLGALFWEVVGRVTGFPFFPPLSAVLERLVELSANGQIFGNLLTSLENLALGLFLAVILGIGIGVLMGAYPKVEAALDIYVMGLLTAPSLIFAPIFYSIFGLSRFSIVLLIVFFAVFVIIINTSTAIRAVSPSLLQMGRSFGGRDLQLFRYILVPAALPLIMAGVRLGAARAVKGMITGEMFIAVVGLGAIVMRASRRFDAETVLAVLVLVTAVAYVVVLVVQRIDARLTHWLPSTRADAT